MSHRPVLERDESRDAPPEASHAPRPSAWARARLGKRAWWIVGAFSLLNLILSCVDLTSRPLSFDEGTTWVTSGQSGLALLHAVSKQGGNMAFYYYVLHYFMSAFGSSLLVLRLPSVLAGVAVVPLCFLVGRRVAGNRVGLIACALSSVSLPLIQWSQNARAYTFGSAFVLASTLFFLRAIEVNTRLDWALWALFSCLAVYCLTEVLFVLVAQLVSVVFLPFRNVPWPRLAVSTAALVLSGSWLAWDVLGKHRVPEITWIPPHPSSGRFPQLANVVGTTASAESQGFYLTIASRILLVLVLLLWAAAALLLVRDVVRTGRSAVVFRRGLIALWLVVPPVLGIFAPPLIHLVIPKVPSTPFYVDRYYTICVPAGAILLSTVLARIRTRTGTVATVAVLMSLQFDVLLPSYGVAVDQFQTPSDIVLAHARPGDCITFRVVEARYNFYYYALGADVPTRLIPRAVLPRESTPTNVAQVFQQEALESAHYWAIPPKSVIVDELKSCSRLWFLEAHVQQTQANSGGAHYENVGVLAKAFQSFYGHPREARFSNVTLLEYQH